MHPDHGAVPPRANTPGFGVAGATASQHHHVVPEPRKQVVLSRQVVCTAGQSTSHPHRSGTPEHNYRKRAPG